MLSQKGEQAAQHAQPPYPLKLERAPFNIAHAQPTQVRKYNVSR